MSFWKTPAGEVTRMIGGVLQSRVYGTGRGEAQVARTRPSMN